MKDDKLLILDCFGLFATDPLYTFFLRHVATDPEAEKIKICAPADRGEYDYQEVLRRTARLVKLPIEEIDEEIKEIAAPRREMIDFALQMREKHTVALLSDCFPGFLDATFAGTAFHRCFDAEFISCRYGVSKPQEQAYRNVLDALGRDYSSIVFLDDNPRNLVPCAKLGIQGILFTDLPQAKKKLQELGY